MPSNYCIIIGEIVDGGRDAIHDRMYRNQTEMEPRVIILYHSLQNPGNSEVDKPEQNRDTQCPNIFMKHNE